MLAPIPRVQVSSLSWQRLNHPTCSSNYGINNRKDREWKYFVRYMRKRGHAWHSKKSILESIRANKVGMDISEQDQAKIHWFIQVVSPVDHGSAANRKIQVYRFIIIFNLIVLEGINPIKGNVW